MCLSEKKEEMIVEIIKLVIEALIPIVVLFVGWKLNKRLKEIEYSQWANQKLVEKKLLLYDEIMPRLNDLFCFYMFVGHWKDISPVDVIDAKRYLDKKVNIYAAILGNGFLQAYDQFSKIAFQTYTAEGADAIIKSVIEGLDGDRRIHCHYEWSSNWDSLFPQKPSFDKIKFRTFYDNVVQAFQRSIGIVHEEFITNT